MSKMFLTIAIMLAGWPATGSGASFDATFDQVLPLCEEYFLPNSMARQPGYDINARMNELETQINRESAAFNSPEGKAYLRARSKTEKDDVAKACIRRLRHAIGDDHRRSTAMRDFDSGNPEIPLADGEYVFRHRFAEQPRMESIHLIVTIHGKHVTVINREDSSVFPLGILDEGDLEWYARQRIWIIAHDPDDKYAPEAGGCSDGPTEIDLAAKIYWTC